MPQLNACHEMKKHLRQLQSLLNPKQATINLSRATILGFKKIWDRNFFSTAEFVEVDQISIQQIEQLFEKTGYISKQQASDVIAAIDQIEDIIKHRETDMYGQELSQSMGMSSWKLNTGSIQVQIDDLNSEIAEKNALIQELNDEIQRLKSNKVTQNNKPKTPSILGKIPTEIKPEKEQPQPSYVCNDNVAAKVEVEGCFYYQYQQQYNNDLCGSVNIQNENKMIVNILKDRMFELGACQEEIDQILRDVPRMEKVKCVKKVCERLLEIMRKDMSEEMISIILQGRPCVV
ncbi:hypothetical protein SS50377_21462 [Spironucleus salmonicida]|uniref:Uncharacterized protein n=1 Tax=Spironucleus salmonicida TaxID=348837 RepID=V6LFD5_9EUKA|nr:hypothetical protein SS50377_21462 [Spironucleus salmonicida]|eukprot:EST42416.1 Hypothetical protein SS50377_17971 [Spironucleus salmonicida]